MLQLIFSGPIITELLTSGRDIFFWLFMFVIFGLRIRQLKIRCLKCFLVQIFGLVFAGCMFHPLVFVHSGPLANYGGGGVSEFHSNIVAMHYLVGSCRLMGSHKEMVVN